MATVTDTAPATSPQIVADAPPREETDGFHLFIDALGSRGSYRGGDPLTGYLTRAGAA